ncbi:MAG TPA: LysM peptidoglycan-binding domain-containing protein [Bacteroidetes bacterium]|nr:LysM peptidoglycan-binding domain-containing protein [Bacteroidota bacterium]
MNMNLMLNRLRVVFFLVVFMYPAMLVSSTISYTSTKKFPLPGELEPAVKFWIKVYTEYNTNEYILHDAHNLLAIYEVVKFSELHREKMDLPQTRSQKNKLMKKRNHYRAILQKLASSKTKLDQLNSEEKRIFDLFGGTKNRSVFRIAAKNIRMQKGQRNRFYNGLVLSGRYMSYIKEIFRKHNLPQELTMLPHVESSFNYRAYSSAGAAGLWQFTRRTGRRFMKISYEIDERLDPILASEAAAKLMQENYQTLGSWPLAITAYNHGMAGMKRAKRKLHTSDIAKIVAKYRSRYFKFASRNFYCEFLAALHIAQNYKKYFGEIKFDPPIQYKEFILPHYVKYATVAQYLHLEQDELKKYNPALRNPIFKGTKYIPQNYKLRVPIYLNVDQLYAQIPGKELFVAQKRSQWYRVRRGDTLSTIARRNRTSIPAIMAMNNLRSRNRIRVGKILRLPDEIKMQKLNKAEETLVASLPSAKENEKIEKETVETVKPAKAIAPDVVSNKPKAVVQPKPVIDLNLPAAGASVSVLPEIELVKNSNPPVGYLRVEPEETLGHYADWLKISTQRIRDWNDLAYGNSIRLGQRIKLVFNNVTLLEFATSRLEYHRAVEEDFFNNYQVLGTRTHKINRGENIWYLCNYLYNLPLWLIQSYNSDLDFNRLKPGDLILIPDVVEIRSNS